MMELVLIIVALGTLTVNTLIYRELRSQNHNHNHNHNVVLTVEEQRAPGAFITECREVYEQQDLSPQTQAEEAEALISVSTVSDKDQHQAWVNRKGIPLTEGIYVPAKPVPVPTPGPLERPGGFAL